MTTRIEIIAQIDGELTRLQRARDFLMAALEDTKNELKTASAIASLKRARTRVPAQKLLPVLAAAPIAAVAPPPPPSPQPQIQHVPPRRRMERRHQQTEKHGKSAAALSGLVPAGPVAVSADEARKVHERAVHPPSPPAVSELRSEIGAERSLGSLIQAFERRAGLNGLETP